MILRDRNRCNAGICFKLDEFGIATKYPYNTFNGYENLASFVFLKIASFSFCTIDA